MQLVFLGGPTLKMVNKTSLVPEGEIICLFNPHGAAPGLSKLRKQPAHIVLVSRAEKQYYDTTAHAPHAIVVDSPGEYEIKGVLINAQDITGDNESILTFRLEADSISVGYVGGMTKMVNGEMMEHLEGIDILILPVGGKGVLGASQAMSLVSQFEPRIVIPIQYKSSKYPVARDTVNKFIKEFGAKNPEATGKLKISRRDLPAEDRRLILLE